MVMTSDNQPCPIVSFVLVRLTHEPSRVGLVRPHLAVHLDYPLLDNLGHLVTGKSVLEPVAEEDGEGKTFPELVGTGGGSGSLRPSQS